jgi:hypothetical protein
VFPATPIRPVRAAPGFDAALNLTAALPLPLAPSTSVIHCTELAAVHVHPAETVTSNVPDPPAAGIAIELGLIDAVQFRATPFCLTATASPPILIAPFRSAPSFGITSNRTLPAPVPLAAPFTTIQRSLVDALHVQPSGTATDTVAVPPFASKRSLVALSWIRQGEASCRTCTCWLLTVIVPCRERPSEFGITRKRTLPLPWPVEGESSVIQLTSAAAFHVHSGGAVMANDCMAPAAATESTEVATVTPHFAGVGPVTVEVDVFPHAAMTISTPAAPPYAQNRFTY